MLAFAVLCNFMVDRKSSYRRLPTRHWKSFPSRFVMSVINMSWNIREHLLMTHPADCHFVLHDERIRNYILIHCFFSFDSSSSYVVYLFLLVVFISIKTNRKVDYLISLQDKALLPAIKQNKLF